MLYLVGKKQLLDINGNINNMKEQNIVVIGAGVAGINAATKLVDNGYPGELITIIDKGNDPHNRLPEEVMTGMLGAGGWSDGKLTYHTEIGGQLAKYCGEEKAMELMKQVVDNFTRFHPKPEEISLSNPISDAEIGSLSLFFLKAPTNLPIYSDVLSFRIDSKNSEYNFLVASTQPFFVTAEAICERS